MIASIRFLTLSELTSSAVPYATRAALANRRSGGEPDGPTRDALRLLTPSRDGGNSSKERPLPTIFPGRNCVRTHNGFQRFLRSLQGRTFA